MITEGIVHKVLFKDRFLVKVKNVVVVREQQQNYYERVDFLTIFS